MYKRIASVILLGLCFSLLANSVHSGPFEKMKATPLPKDQFRPPSVPPSPDGGFCIIQNDDGTPTLYTTQFDSGVGIAVYMDPEKCGVQTPYPFKITDVHLYLYGAFSDSIVWPVKIRVNIRELSENHKCNGPGHLLFSQPFLIPVDSGSSNLGRPMNLSLSQPVCTSYPFFLEIEYETKTDTLHPLPSLLMDNDVALADSCDNWGTEYGNYYRWREFWDGTCPGDAIIRTTGYAHTIECDSCWYWKPDRPDQEFPAPSGMPDFGQYQFGPPDSVGLCGPTAVANCLWWFDAVPQGMNPPDFIRLLSTYFHTHPNTGTLVDSMESRLDRYFNDHGFFLYEHTYYQPDFYEVDTSLKKSQDIILLLGFWQYDETKQMWFRFGGHFVAVSGVCFESSWVALSDPARDAAEWGGTGRVRPIPHPSHTEGDTLHNDPHYISHDIFQAVMPSPSPGGLWSLPDYDSASCFEGQNFQPGQEYHPYIPTAPVFTEIEYALMILSYICGDCNSDGKIDATDVVGLINYLFINGPAPVPGQAGDVNTDGGVNIADVVYLINYLFIGGPPPCTGE